MFIWVHFVAAGLAIMLGLINLVLENGNMINLIDGIYPVIVYKKHSYFIQTDYMGGNKAYICKSKKKLITN